MWPEIRSPGADYQSTGVQADEGSVTLHMYQKYQGELVAVGPQVYLLDEKGHDYEMLHLLSQEISFEVDVSNLPCGMNGGMYLAEMEPSGGRGPLNPAGASLGTGYCDSQCYTSYAFVNGVANVDGSGTCCNEMDLWEANSKANQLTPHPCSITGFYACEEKECGDGKKGVCDKVGCSFNPYALGAQDFYGVHGKADTSKPFRVITRFITDDGTKRRNLVEIRRMYVQDGKALPNAEVTLRRENYNPIIPSYCQATDADSFARHEGLDSIGGALRRGMVLVMGIWNEGTDNLNWLDAGDAGPCNRMGGSPTAIKKNYPKTSVTFSDIRWGGFGTTC
ncbi:uncharacterized protein LTR77_003453 [Saxophila tyrrhenica]|uniref:Glucanase n=1 Tax=Saxophila tyrrhenica TaxID=1690608 RepID=A0AAV9PF01_9PEZI|nr:hypothetical protein LTR77_003453 [Saxophila tyrrhenica]